MTKQTDPQKTQVAEAENSELSKSVIMDTAEVNNEFSKVDFKGSKWIYFMVIGLNAIYILLFYWINQLYGNS
ncbi:hypothetical protein N9J65_05785 [Flavobacteriaceae bacterium]|nr:hypothetical protein [Flavobacteriaceae bacterium]